jgi:hypothetical protein
MLPNWKGIPLLLFFGRFPIYVRAVKFWRPVPSANFYQFFHQLEIERQKSKKGHFWDFPTIASFAGIWGIPVAKHSS